MKTDITNRLSDCKLTLNEAKTRMVYCKDSHRKGSYENISFDFLGYTFRPREAKNRKTGIFFTSFLPGISQKSKNRIRSTIRSCRLSSDPEMNLIKINSIWEASVRGWINYYGKFYPSVLKSTLQMLNHVIVRWARRKYKRFKGSFKRAWMWLIRVYQKHPKTFYHWFHGVIPCYFKLKPVKIRRAV